MNNFTKCCSSLGSLQKKGKATLVLFMFLALTSLSYAQGTGANNTGGGEEIGPINGSMYEVPARKSVSELMAPGYFGGFFDACHDSNEAFEIHLVDEQQGVDGEWGVATGFAKGSDHCSWTYYYVYSVKCAGEVTPFTVKYNGGDATSPWVPKHLKSAYNAAIADMEGLDVCYDNRPTAPTADEIKAFYTDNSEHVKVYGEMVTKRTKTKNDDCGWVEINIYTVKDYCEDNAFEFSITYSGSDQSAPVFNEKVIEGLKDITVDCDKIPDAIGIPYTDNCAPSGKAKLHEEVSTIVEGEECRGGVIERWWKATDECGNNAWHKQTITVRPAVQAVFNEPQNISITCENRNNIASLIPDLYYTNGMEGDCNISGYAKPEYTAPDSNCASFPVKYSFIDNCGREIIEYMTVTIFDDVPPAFTNAAEDLTVECDGEGNVEDYMNWIASNGGASAQDNCTAPEDLVWSNNAAGRSLTDDCGATGEITVIFTVNDSCGNPSKTYATFKIVDTTDPETTPAYNKTVVCDGEGNVDQFQVWLDSYGDATAKDECSGVTWTNNFPGDPKHKDFDMADYLKEGCSEYTGYINVIFTVTDACGNDVDLPATFTIEDSIAPEMTPASDMIVECDSTIPDIWKTGVEYSEDELEAQGGAFSPGTNAYAAYMWLKNHGGATATDGCSKVKWAFKIIGVYGDSCDTEYRVTFYAYDECHNISSSTASFHIQDTLSPMIGEEAQDLIVECGQDFSCDEQRGGCDSPFMHWLHTNGGAKALDMCDKELTWTNDWNGKDLTDECGNTGRITVTFTVTDNCGLSSATAAEYRIVDTIAPTLHEPQDITLQLDDKCEADITPYNTGMAEAWDACSSVDITFSDVSDKQACLETITRTWKATDDCGNVTTKVQYIYLEDKLAPVLTGTLSDLNISNLDACEAPAPPSLESVGAMFSDACGYIVVELLSTNVISDSTCDWAVQYHYAVSDNCGNYYDGTVKVTHWGSDQTAPNLMDGEKLPEGASGINACIYDAIDANPPVADHEIEKIFEDNCDEKVSAKSELVITEEACKWAFHYVYTVTDDCGNETSFNQYFSGEDFTAPVLVGTIPQDVSDIDSCKDEVEGPSEAEIAALFHDSCGVNVVRNVHSTGTNCNWLYSFEYTVTDNCGNAYPMFKITYQGGDETAPVITECAADDHRAYGEGMPTPATDVVSVDDCSSTTTAFADSSISESAGPDVVVGNDLIMEFANYGIQINFGPAQPWGSVYYGVFEDLNGNYLGGFESAILRPNYVFGDHDIEYYFLGSFYGYLGFGGPQGDVCNGGWILYDSNFSGYNCEQTAPTVVKSYTRTFTVTDECGNDATCSADYSYTELANQAPVDVTKPEDAKLTTGTREEAPAAAPDADVELSFQAYPVPFNQDVTVKYNFEFDTDVTVEVYDTKGLLVMSKKAAYKAGVDATMPLRINGADQMYYVKLITNKGTVTKKILASKL